MWRITFALLTAFVSCTDNKEIETTILIEIEPHCDQYNSSTLVVTKQPLETALVSSMEDIIYHPHGLDFEICLPDEFDFCGYMPIYGCSVGEPDPYYAIDSTLKKNFL